MDEAKSEEEQMMEAFDPAQLPKEFKKEVRQQWHFQLWLMQKTYKEIRGITGFSRDTIWKDIKEVQARLAATPRTIDDIIQIAMMSLRVTKAEAMAAARMAMEEKNPRWDRIAKLFGIAASIDTAILTRFTQPALVKQPSTADDEKSQIILEFIVSKFGPEGLDDFNEYYTRQLTLKRNLKAGGVEAQ